MFANLFYQVQVFLLGRRSPSRETAYPGLAEAVRPLTRSFVNAAASDEQ